MAEPAVLVVNTGSSSVKFGVYAVSGGTLGPCLIRGAVRDLAADRSIDLAGPDDICAAVRPALVSADREPERVVASLADALAKTSDRVDIRAAGHRVVHGGLDHVGPARLDAPAMERLKGLSPLAPSHQPHNLAGVRAIASVWPDLPQSASFDTAFHRTQPHIAQIYALPKALTQEGVVRYGFHGLSYAYMATRLPQLAGPIGRRRVIVAHLGSGASLCAMKDGQSVASTMGFTALDGLPMGTRCGDLDPGVVLHLLKNRGLSVAEVEALLYRESGFLGVSGESADVRDLLASGSDDAKMALDLFAYRVARDVGSLVSALGGLDMLVFTAGVGENAPEIRRMVSTRLGWAGVALDETANETGQQVISGVQSSVRLLVVKTDEESVIARETAATCLA